MGVSKNRGVPPNHPFVHRVFHYKPSILGEKPLFLETSIWPAMAILGVRLLVQFLLLQVVLNFREGVLFKMTWN